MLPIGSAAPCPFNPLEPRPTWVQHQLYISAASKSMELFQPYPYSTVVQLSSFLARTKDASGVVR